MKRTFATLALLVLFIAQAQFRINNDKADHLTDFDNQKFSWGYYLGINYFDFKIHPDKGGINDYGRFTVISDGKLGFSAGLIGKMRVSNYFDMLSQPGIHFTERTLYFNNNVEGTNVLTPENEIYTITAEDSVRTVKSSYIDIPLLIQVHGDRWYNTRPYFQAGIGWAINLQSEESSEDDNEDGVFRLKTNNFNWQMEMGVSIYFRRFKMTPSVKGMFFFNNELVADDPTTPPIWAGALKSVSTRAVMFSIKFE